MAISRTEMDRKIDRHFAFEAWDDVAGVLRALAPYVDHDIVGCVCSPVYLICVLG